MRESITRTTAFIILNFFLAGLSPVVSYETPQRSDLLMYKYAEIDDNIIHSGMVSPDDPARLELGGVILELPAGSVMKDTEITVQPLGQVESLNDGMANVTSGSEGYRFGPAGIHFEKTIRVTIPYDSSLNESETALSNLFTYFYDTEQEKWIRLERYALNREEATITSLTNHFTDMINSTLQLPEAASPVDFNLNSIKDLEAMNPTAEIPEFKGLSPSPMGSASFQLPLKIPSGRGAAIPELSVSYSSDSPSGWLGKGFNISQSLISIDTKFGLPDYDGKDTYALDGEELVLVTDAGSYREYRARTEKSFSLIRYYGTAPGGYWQVTDKTGTVKTYGSSNAWTGPDLSNKKSGVFSWYLSEICDVNGNTVSYSYNRDSDYYVYLESINYAGYKSGSSVIPGFYTIRFTNDSTKRPDCRLDARGKFPSKLTERLKRIDIYGENLLIRSYEFEYEQNEFGQTELTRFSESIGNKEFYAYDFEYERLPVQADGYAAFGDTQEVWSSREDHFRSLSRGVTSSAGGSLYLGLKFAIKILRWEKIIANFGVRGGVNFSKNMNKSRLLDVNGDGLPDAVWNDSTGFYAYLNDNGEFETGVTPLGSLAGNMDAGKQDSFSLGMSVGLLGVQGGITKQYTWSETETSFADINGDGFVDQVKKGSSTYRRNDGGSSFVNEPYTVETAATSLSSDTSAEKEEFNKTYFRQDPVRMWKSYYSGTLSVENSIRFDGSAPGSSPASADIYISGSNTPRASLTPPSDGSTAGNTMSLSLDQYDRLYFHLNAGEDGRRNTVNWNSRIKYESIRYLEDMTGTAYFNPLRGPISFPSRLSGDLYDSLYEEQSEWDEEDGYVFTYTLKKDWQKYMTPSIADQLFQEGRFVPAQIPEIHFKKLHDGLSEDRRSILLGAFDYLPEFNVFVRLNSSADSLFTNQGVGWSDEEKDTMFYYTWLDGSRITPSGGEDASYTSHADLESLPSRILNQTAPAPSGETSKDLSVTADRIYSGDGNTLLWSYVLKKEDSRYKAYKIVASGEEIDLNTGITPSADELVWSFSGDGREHSYRFAGKNHLPESLPASLYEAKVIPEVMTGKESLYRSLYSLSETDGTALYALLEEEGKNVFDSSYVLTEGVFLPAQGADLYEVAALILPHIQSETIFNVFPPDTEGTVSAALFSPENHSLFTDWLNANGYESLSSLWTEEQSGSESLYLLKDGLEDPSVLEQAIRLYRFQAEEFPYYDKSGELYTLKDSLTDEERQNIRTVMEAVELYSWDNLFRAITYRASTAFVTEDVQLPSGAAETPLAAGSTGLAQPGENTSRLTFLIHKDGKTRVIYKYIHQYDSSSDFASENLVNYDLLDDMYVSLEEGEEPPQEYSEEDINDRGQEVFRGGSRGWFYGFWTGNYKWNESLQNRRPDVNEGAEEVTPPPYFVSAEINKDRTLIRTSGREFKWSVPSGAWTGSVTEYDDAELDAEGRTSYTKYTFSSFIERDTMHPQRSGGDAYFRRPVAGNPVSGGSIGVFTAGKSESTDYNGSGFGLNISKNLGKGWQYTLLTDLNGDRYPDIIQFPENSGNNYVFVPGTGSGFGTPVTGQSDFNFASYSVNNTLGFGATPGGISGSINQILSSTGKIRSSNVDSPSASISGGVNGTLGESIQTIVFQDINGDGLPDHLRRTGSGSFEVRLNKGNNSFTSPYSWGNSLSHSFQNTDPEGKLSTSLKGVSHSNSGSFGGSVTVGALGASLNTGMTANVSRTHFSLMDINGDGLPDQVTKDKEANYFLVRFNLGDTFSSQTIKLYRPDWAGVNLKTGMISTLEQDLSTLAGQLGEMVLPGDHSWNPNVNLPNFKNSPFGDLMNPLEVEDVLNYSSGVNINLGASYTFDIRIWLLYMTIVPGLNGAIGTTGATIQMMDIDGDGLPDHILKMPGTTGVHVKRNSMGRVGLLKTIHTPTGSTYSLDYEREGNTTAMPQNKYVLSQVSKTDGLEGTDSGVHTYTETYKYSGGYHDRLERQFYGFATVETRKGDGSLIIQDYYNNSLITKGLPKKTTVINESTGKIYQQSEKLYSPVLIRTSAINGPASYTPRLDAEVSRTFDPASQNYLETTSYYNEYDAYGNVIRLTEEGIGSDPSDDLHLSIAYDTSLPGYLKAHPARLEVTDSEGNLLRLRTGKYNSQGKLVTLNQYDTNWNYSSYTLAYDTYGNLSSLTDPRGYKLSYSYDNKIHSFITKIQSSNSNLGGGTYTSTAKWNYYLGKETESTDISGHTQTKKYDQFGRLTEIRSPYDTGSTPVLAYTYNTDSIPWTAVTANKITFDPFDNSTMDTVVTTDALGRIIQTAKEGEVYNPDTNSSVTGWNRSGRVIYDIKGRPVKEGQTSFEGTSALPSIAPLIRPTLKEYDILDRITKITLPDNSTMSTTYALEGNRTKETSTDPENNVTETHKDWRGNIRAIRKQDSSKKILTTMAYDYNVMGELTRAVDHYGKPVSFTYDLLGRRTETASLDAGTIRYTYDESGNLKTKEDSNLRAAGETIQYFYDGHNRLTKVDYPWMGDTTFTYGDQNASSNRKGRLISRTDESGVVEYKYGKMGETTHMTRTLHRLMPLEYDRSVEFSYNSDYLGRMQSILYPDGEEVVYGYDNGGQVTSVTGTLRGEETKYVENIGYDEYGQRIYIRYGNGTETNYSYDENRRWLDSINTLNGSGDDYQNLIYSFDKVGNVLGTTNITGSYSTTQDYVYDDLYQLTRAQGSIQYTKEDGIDYQNLYRQDFSFDETGNMLTKNSFQNINTNEPAAWDLNYDLEYEYFEEFAHRAKKIGNIYYRYDENGNTIEESYGGLSSDEDWASVHPGRGQAKRLGNSEKSVPYGIGKKDPAKDNGNSGNDSGYRRIYFWDEENRLKRSEDASNTVEYLYDADGQRTVKYSGKHDEALYFDSMWQENTDNPSFRLMKHIYLGETRIASRMKIEGDYSHGYESINTYYYHSDHLGSANIVTDYQGDIYEHIEYTPYGELFEEIKSDNFDRIPFRFTGKELDRETNLYYHGARYMDPRTSRWISSDPAGWELINPMQDGKTRQGFSIIESQGWYGYVSNNPVKYRDVTGFEQHNTFTLVLVRNRTPEQSMNNPSTEGQDYFILSTKDGAFYYSGFQGSATRKTPEGNNDSVAHDSEVTFTLRGDSSKSFGKSMIMSGGKTVDGRNISSKGIPEGSNAENSVHGNSEKGFETSEYSTLVSEGCPVGPVETYKELLDKVESLGVKEGDTWSGGVLDAEKMGP